MSSLQRAFFERPEEFYADQEARASAQWVREYLARQDRAMFWKSEGVESVRAELRGSLGLSNQPYLAGDVSDVKISARVNPAGVEFRLSDRINRTAPPPAGAGQSFRGRIRELSEKSRRRLQSRAYSLQAQGFKARLMLTLTSPGNWEQVYLADEHGELVNGGRLLKEHLSAFRKRLARFLGSFPGLKGWRALWFLEFQKRGAPHFHIMLFAVSIPDEVRRLLVKWIGAAWSDIVGNPVEFEQKKHRKAGTQVARMRTEHFGYAAKYASKPHQKDVPENFQSVGRFWGNWNHREPEPIEVSLDLQTFQDVDFVLKGIHETVHTVHQQSGHFVRRVLGLLSSTLLATPDGVKIRRSVGFQVYGTDARRVFLDWLEEPAFGAENLQE